MTPLSKYAWMTSSSLALISGEPFDVKKDADVNPSRVRPSPYFVQSQTQRGFSTKCA